MVFNINDIWTLHASYSYYNILSLSIINNFKTRVDVDGGTFEAESCLSTVISDLNDDTSLLDDASLVVTPNAKKAGKLYSIIPTNGAGDLNVVRATTATYVDADGLIKTAGINEPRFDYSNGSCPSILVEPQRTNLFLRSEEFDNSYWNKYALSVTPNTTLSPSGFVNADMITSTANSVDVMVLKVITITSGTAYSISFYAKQNTQRFVYIRLTSNATYQNYVFAVFDLQDGTVGQTSVGTTSGTLISSNVQYAGNGFYRVSITASINATDGNIGIGFAASKTGNTFDAGGTITSRIVNSGSIFLWGAQLEAGSNATSYIPTTTSSVTRNADVISKSGIYTNGLITSAGGTMFIELKNNIPVIASNFSEFNLSIGSTSNGYGGNGSLSLWNFSAGISRLQIIKNVGGTYSILYTSTTDNCKIVIKWNGTTVDVFENGVKVVNASSFNITNMNFLYGNGLRRSFLLDKMFLFTTPLTDTQAIQLTTL